LKCFIDKKRFSTQTSKERSFWDFCWESLENQTGKFVGDQFC